MPNDSRLTINGDMTDLLAVKQMLTTRKHTLENHRRGEGSETAKARRAEEIAWLDRVLTGMTIGLAPRQTDDSATRHLIGVVRDVVNTNAHDGIELLSSALRTYDRDSAARTLHTPHDQNTPPDRDTPPEEAEGLRGLVEMLDRTSPVIKR